MRVFASIVAISMAAVISVAGSSAASAAPQKSKTVAATKEPKMIVIESGDNLSKIASANETTFQRIYFANTDIDDPDLIFPGQKVRIPTADEKLAERPLPANAPVAVEAPVQAPAATQSQRSTYQPVAAAPVASGSVWDQLAMCEAGGNWSINTGNGFYGGLQFTLSSWQAVGGTGYPHQASREEQIARGEMLLALQGWGAWPACTSKLGLR